MHRTISISCFNVLSRVNDFDRCFFFCAIEEKTYQFGNVENLTLFYFVISKLVYIIYYGEHLEVLLNVYSLEMFYLIYISLLLNFNCEPCEIGFINQILMLLFAVVKLQVIYYFCCRLCQHLNSILTSLLLFSQNMAFILYKLFVLLNCFPIP